MGNKNKLGLPGGPDNEIIVDSRGQWDNPGKNTRIPGNNITMKDVAYPVWAQPNVGPGTMMMPGSEHHFKNAEYVDEYPMAVSYDVLVIEFITAELVGILVSAPINTAYNSCAVLLLPKMP